MASLNEIKFHNLAFPLLFLSFVSRASEVVGKKILLKIDNRKFLLNYNNSIYYNSLDDGIITIGNHISITFLDNVETHLMKMNGKNFINFQKIPLLKKMKV